MTLKARFMLIYILVILLFLGNFVYLFYIMKMAAVNSRELKEKDIKITLYAERLKLDTVQVQQWLTDISATRAAEGYANGFDEAQKSASDFRNTIQELKILDKPNLNMLEEHLISFETYYSTGKKMAMTYIDEGPTEGNKVMDQFDSYAQDINNKIEMYRVEAEKSIENKILMLEETINRTKYIATITVFLTTILTFIFVYISIRSIVRAIHQLYLRSEEYALGNLTEKISINRKDEIGKLARSMSVMQENLRKMIQSVNDASTEVSENSKGLTHSSNEVKDGSIQIASTMQELAAGSESQANSASELSEKMDMFNQGIVEANENGENVLKSSQNVLKMTKDGHREMDRSVKKMTEINQIFKESVTKVKVLDQQTKEISELVNVIKSISEQTNLLALNAAIEAVRAGEAGKGFAVVADEVRKLADGVAVSVSNITDIVRNIQEGSSHVVGSLESGYNKVIEGTVQIQSTGEKFQVIETFVTEMVEQIGKIGSHLSKLTLESKELNQHIENVSAVAEESASGIEEVAASIQETSSSIESVSKSAEQLTDLANELNEQIKKFRIE